MSIITVLLLIVEVVVCLMLVALVLIQRSKGDGLSAAIGGGVGEAMFGAQVGNVVTRATVVLGIVFLLNTIVLSLVMSRSAAAHSTGSVTDDLPLPAASATMPDSTLPMGSRGPRMPVAPNNANVPINLPATAPAAPEAAAAPAAPVAPVAPAQPAK